MSEISQKQLEANQENAKLGGVKTEEGKAISRYNAVKHGILTKDIILPDESQVEMDEFAKKIRTELKPTNEIEMVLVERIIANTWRLKRALKAEKEMVENGLTKKDWSGKLENKNLGEFLNKDFMNYDAFGKFTRYESCLERGLYKALHELQRIQAARFGEKIPAPVAIDIDISKEE